MRNRIIRNLVMMLLIVAALTSCNDVFYSGVSGTVRDKDTSQGIAGMNVYAYTSEDAWNKAYSSWKEGTIFEDNSCLFRSTTGNNGDFNVAKIVWTTNSPTWSKDYDSSNVYLIFFSEEYGLSKVGPVALVSGVSNQSAVTVELEKKVQSSSVTLSFTDMSSVDSNQPVDANVSFTYSYNNGYRTITQNASVEGGEAIINLEYPKGSKCTLTVSNVKDPSGCYSYVPAAGNQHTFEIQDSSQKAIIPMKRDAFLLAGNAIYGELLIAANQADMLIVSTLHVYTEIGGKTYTVDLSEPVFVGGDEYVGYTYSGLAANALIPVESDGTAFGFKDIPINVFVSDSQSGKKEYVGATTLSQSSSSLKCNLKKGE